MNHFKTIISPYIIFVILLGFLIVFGGSVSRVDAAASTQILSHTGYLDSSGYYNVVEEILNSGDQALQYVKVTATFYNSTGAMVGTDYTYTTLDLVLAGRKSPFNLYLWDKGQSAKVHHYSLYASFSTTSPISQGLQILSNSSYTDGIGYLHIIGEIKNTGTIQATFVSVIATCYNSTGGVVATDYSYTSPTDLNPNQTAPYDISVSSDRTPYVHHYVVSADSTQYAVVPEFNIITLVVTLIPITVALLFLNKRKSLPARATVI
ncbi:FxLYD domain-containing protein [Candidatus Bathyarchaeota archaeon]|nr:FxLYD domain-containing protein [Candidatus Bathyarchaeota archaeon]